MVNRRFFVSQRLRGRLHAGKVQEFVQVSQYTGRT
jgi:hypothetical protein